MSPSLLIAVLFLQIGFLTACVNRTGCAHDGFAYNAAFDKCLRLFGPEYSSLPDQAEHYCRSFGYNGHLISIHSPEQDADFHQRYGADAPTYIGLAKVNGNFRWTDGSTVEYTNFITTSNGNYAYDAGTPNGGWRADNGTNRRFVCASDPIYQKCSQAGFVYHDTLAKCIYVESKVINMRSFSSAENYCRAYGGHLTSIHSQQQANTVFTALPYDSYAGLQIQSGNYVWTDGSAADYTGFINGSTSGTCLVGGSSPGGSGGWFLTDCTSDRFFICEVDQIQDQTPCNGQTTPTTTPTTTPPPVPPTTTTPLPCPAGWLASGRRAGICFYVDDGGQFDWYGASDRCASLDARAKPVTIANNLENSEVINLSGNSNAWLGLQRSGSNWSWSNGYNGNYRNWAQGEPSNSTQLACSRLDGASGRWYAVNCYDYNAAACVLSLL